jgi:sulfur relay (sulfurtransferase) complex TusBCD TusD component (DsrE family)
MGSISIILRRPPYGTVDASEALRHALGAVTDDMKVKLLLVNGGVHAARKGQDASQTEYLNAGEGIQDCIDMGVSVHADDSSLKREQISNDCLIEGVTISSSAEIADIIGKTDTTMIF